MVVLLALPSVAEAHVLSYAKAKSAVQKRANLWAGRRAEVHVLRRTNRHEFYARARWQDLGVPPGEGSGQRCVMAMRVHFASPTSRKVLVSTEGPRCS
jgi:hypothetical protein